MVISAETVKELREKTGSGIMDCKRALQEAKGDMEKAVEILRKKGLAAAGKKAGRATKEGVIYSYIHPGNKIGVLLELNCETDFVARTEEFIQLAKDICMHIAALSPSYIKKEDIPLEEIEKEKEIYAAQLKESGKPQHIIEKIIEGKLEKTFFAEKCLLKQTFIKDTKKTIAELLAEKISKFGENIVIKRFTRYQLGS